MDFATISKLILSSGYKQTITSSQIISYETNYSRGADKISVHWKLGGYVHLILVNNESGVLTSFESAEEFINSFSEN